MRIIGLLISALLCTACGKFQQYELPIAWWVQCDHSLQAPISRVADTQVRAPNGYYFTTFSNYAAELYGCLPIPPGYPEEAYKRVLYSVKLTDLHDRTAIEFFASAELTNDLYTQSVLVSWYLVLAPTHTAVEGDEMSIAHGYNCTPGMHHCEINESGIKVLTKDYDAVYLNFIVLSSGAEMRDANLVIEPRYGGLNGRVIGARE